MLENNWRNRNVKISNAPTEKVKFIWNMVGSGCFSSVTMLLSLIVIKISGPELGGDFAISLTIGQMVLCVAYFEMRTFQVTDIKKEFQFGEYHTGKMVLCLVALMAALSYTWVKGYELQKSVIIALVCFARLLDGYADVYEAEFQKVGRLDITGKSLLYRTLWYAGTLCIVLIISKRMILSLLIADIVAVFALWRYDIRIMKKLGNIECSPQWRVIFRVLKECFPLFIGSFCWTYILSASRIAIDANMPSEYQSYFQVIFMPVSVISLFASFIFKPMLPNLSKAYYAGDGSRFYGSLRNGILCVGVITFMCMLSAYFVGIPILSFFSGCNLKDYRGILVFLIFAGGFNAVSFVMYYALTVMRCYKGILGGYVSSAFVGFFISSPMVKKDGILGAAWSYFIVVVVLCALFGVFIWRNIGQGRQRSKIVDTKKDVIE